MAKASDGAVDALVDGLLDDYELDVGRDNYDPNWLKASIIALISQALADEAERVELEFIIETCFDGCANGCWPKRITGDTWRPDFWVHEIPAIYGPDPQPAEGYDCDAAAMWERRYQRAKAKEAEGVPEN